MIELYLHNRALVNIIELLGDNENDITAGIGWALSHSSSFLNGLMRHVFPKVPKPRVECIKLQNYHNSHGITDVEIIGDEVHCIIEAKRGWNVPRVQQLQKYATKLSKSRSQNRVLVVMAECSDEYARFGLHLRRYIAGIKIIYLSWRDVFDFCLPSSACTHAEKRLLTELRVYLRRIVSMQDQESNQVYVIAAGGPGIQDWCGMSWRDYVLKKRLFFLPVRGRTHWPKEDPPNYLGFRYEGKLSIHHVEKYEIVSTLFGHIPRVRRRKSWMDKPHYLCKLGPPIIDPPHEIRATKVLRNFPVRSALDLLLTCKTIPEACRKTNKRLN